MKYITTYRIFESLFKNSNLNRTEFDDYQPITMDQKNIDLILKSIPNSEVIPGYTKDKRESIKLIRVTGTWGFVDVYYIGDDYFKVYYYVSYICDTVEGVKELILYLKGKHLL